MKKVFFVIMDGLGDRPIKELNYKTPLEYAKTPFLDALAKRAICGMVNVIGVGKRPSSDVAHMELFGLDHTKEYPGRGPIELIGSGIQMSDGDIAFRGNFAVISEDGRLILDRRAGRKSPSEELLESIREVEIDNVKFTINHVAEHRFALKVSGRNISKDVSDSDPHLDGQRIQRIIPKTTEKDAVRTADLLNQYTDIIEQKMRRHHLDSSCTDDMNTILLRGCGMKPNWVSMYDRYELRSFCITNNALYHGIGQLLGMGSSNYKHYDNYKEYYGTIPELIHDHFSLYDFFYIHLQETDLCGEDGDYLEKVRVIEEMDHALSFLDEYVDDAIIVVTSDHSTPCVLKAHSGDSVPIMIFGNGLRFDHVTEFSEFGCQNGGLGTILGREVMSYIINLMGRAKLIGN